MFTYRLLASIALEIYRSNDQTDLYPLLSSLVTILIVIYECVHDPVSGKSYFNCAVTMSKQVLEEKEYG